MIGVLNGKEIESFALVVRQLCVNHLGVMNIRAKIQRSVGSRVCIEREVRKGNLVISWFGASLDLGVVQMNVTPNLHLRSFPSRTF